MRMKSWCGVLTGSLICVCALLGEQSPAPPTAEVTTKEAPVTFKSGVNLVPVPVVVRDGHGRAIGNLGRDDFQLYDNGKLQMISKFSVEKLGTDAAVPAASSSQPVKPAVSGEKPADAQSDGIPDRFVAYLFDDLHMSPADLIYTRDAARRQIDSAEHTRERVAIYTTSGRPFQEFTSDREKLHRALAAISTGRADATTSFQQNSCPPMTYYMADLIYNKQDDVALALAVTDALNCANLDPAHAQEVALATTMAKQAARQGLFHGNQETMASLETLRNVVSRMGTMPGQRTIVLVSSGFMVLDVLARDEQTALIEGAIHLNIVINALDARGLFVSTMLADASQHMEAGLARTIPRKDSYGRMESTAESGEMATIAESTGGSFYQNSNNYDEGISRAAATPEYLYVLGFSPLDLKPDGKYHNLKVTLKSAKGMDVQVRKGYYAPSYAATPEEQAKQEIEEAFFSRDEAHDLPAALQTQFFKTSDNDTTLSAVAKIDVKKLNLRKEDGRNLDNLTVVTGLFDNDGNYISAVQKTVELRLLDETLEKRVGSGVGVKSDFTVHSGKYMVRMVVRDSEGKTMAEQSSLVEIP